MQYMTQSHEKGSYCTQTVHVCQDNRWHLTGSLELSFCDLADHVNHKEAEMY